MADQFYKSDLRGLTTIIVSSFVKNHSVRNGELPSFNAMVYDVLSDLHRQRKKMNTQSLIRPVSIRNSIHLDYLTSMEDGKRYKSLKRHLAGQGLSPMEYRAKWGLPFDYPMTAPNYSQLRSQLAKATGLGGARSRLAASKSESAGSQKVDLPEAEEIGETDQSSIQAKRGNRSAVELEERALDGRDDLNRSSALAGSPLRER